MYFVISGDTWNLKKQLKKNSVLKQKKFCNYPENNERPYY